jgi:hypothetical protein
MGFLSDLGNGIASIVEAPFKGVADVVQGVGNGIGSILNGSSAQPACAPQYMNQCAQGMQGQDPCMATQMLQFENALLMNMLLMRQVYPQQMAMPSCGC